MIKIVSILSAALLIPALSLGASAQSGMAAHAASSIGLRAAFYDPTDAVHGEWAPGAQLHTPLSSAYVLEGSIDWAHYSSMGTNVHVTPIQLTLIDYLYPDSSLSPYFLIGGGWYLTHADGAYDNRQRRFGPHVGVGLDLILGDRWSLDGSYRYLWSEIISFSQARYLVGTGFRERGNMYTIGLNYHF